MRYKPNALSSREWNNEHLQCGNDLHFDIINEKWSKDTTMTINLIAELSI